MHADKARYCKAAYFTREMAQDLKLANLHLLAEKQL
jgi:hypothetical protein